MVNQLLGKSGRPSFETGQPATHPTVSTLNTLGVLLADQVAKIRQQGGEFFPAVGGVEVNLSSFEPFEQIADSGLIALAHCHGQDLFCFAAIGIQYPDFVFLFAHKRPHFVNLDFMVAPVAGFDANGLSPAENQPEHRPSADQQHWANVADTAATQQHPLNQPACGRVAGVVKVLLLELLSAVFAPVVLLPVGLFAIFHYLVRLAVEAFDLTSCFAHRAQSYASAASFFTPSYI